MRYMIYCKYLSTFFVVGDNVNYHSTLLKTYFQYKTMGFFIDPVFLSLLYPIGFVLLLRKKNTTQKTARFDGIIHVHSTNVSLNKV